MKYIIKGTEPKKFLSWKALANINWQPTYNDLRGEEKQAVKSALMEEQGYICCYCERELSDNDSHIEHFKPQSDRSVDSLDFSNMLCSCQKQLEQGEPRHCGNLKGSWFDNELLVSPLAADCEKKFTYIYDGYIQAANNNPSASETISKLGLGIDKLNDLRRKAIEPFIDDELSEDELKIFLDGYLRKKNGKFNSFHTTLLSLFGG